MHPYLHVVYMTCTHTYIHTHIYTHTHTHTLLCVRTSTGPLRNSLTCRGDWQMLAGNGGESAMDAPRSGEEPALSRPGSPSRPCLSQGVFADMYVVICIYMYIDVCVFSALYTSFIHIPTFTYGYIYIYIHTCIYMCTYIHIYIYRYGEKRTVRAWSYSGRDYCAQGRGLS